MTSESSTSESSESFQPMEVAPLRGLRYDVSRTGEPAENLTAPPYDVISPKEHAALVARSPFNITRLTLGDGPAAAEETSDAASGSGPGVRYEERARRLAEWIESGALVRDEKPTFYAYVVDYAVPTGSGARARLYSFIGLGKLHRFEDRVILPHERTFAKVVEDRKQLLAATGTQLESIFLLYSDPEGEIDAVLIGAAEGEPLLRVEARPGETHSLFPIRGTSDQKLIRETMRAQRPIIADGHHRYTTSVLYAEELAKAGNKRPGCDWQLMTFANLESEGLAILATHRMVSLAKGSAADALAVLAEHLEPANDDDWQMRVESRDATRLWRFPAAVLEERRGVARTSYALLDSLVLGDWLRDLVGAEPKVAYFKEGTGEDEALREGRGDLLFRLRPVGRREFREVVEGGEVYPHKTTYFYPKLWSGMVLWPLEDPTT